MAYGFNEDKSKVEVYSKSEMTTDYLTTEMHTISLGTVNANSTARSEQVNVAKTGYTAIAVVGFTAYGGTGTKEDNLCVSCIDVNSNKVIVRAKNTGSTSLSNAGFGVRVLYRKNI